MRLSAFLATALAGALFSLTSSGCGSDDAGKTLTIKLHGGGMVLTTETISTSPTTPTLYEGKGSVVAEVVYRGDKELAYAWSVSTPGEVSLELESNENELGLTGKVVALPENEPNVGDGIGTVRLIVYESNGTLRVEESAPLYIIASSGG